MTYFASRQEERLFVEEGGIRYVQTSLLEGCLGSRAIHSIQNNTPIGVCKKIR